MYYLLSATIMRAATKLSCKLAFLSHFIQDLLEHLKHLDSSGNTTINRALQNSLPHLNLCEADVDGTTHMDTELGQRLGAISIPKSVMYIHINFSLSPRRTVFEDSLRRLLCFLPKPARDQTFSQHHLDPRIGQLFAKPKVNWKRSRHENKPDSFIRSHVPGLDEQIC